MRGGAEPELSLLLVVVCFFRVVAEAMHAQGCVGMKQKERLVRAPFAVSRRVEEGSTRRARAPKCRTSITPKKQQP
eukprot:1777236-Pleurochrysis_carterae.AAC.1